METWDQICRTLSAPKVSVGGLIICSSIMCGTRSESEMKAVPHEVVNLRPSFGRRLVQFCLSALHTTSFTSNAGHKYRSLFLNPHSNLRHPNRKYMASSCAQYCWLTNLVESSMKNISYIVAISVFLFAVLCDAAEVKPKNPEEQRMMRKCYREYSNSCVYKREHCGAPCKDDLCTMEYDPVYDDEDIISTDNECHRYQ